MIGGGRPGRPWRPILGWIVLGWWLCLAPSIGLARQPKPTPFTGEGAFTLECRGTTTVNGTATAATRTYAVDTKRCVVEPWPVGQCTCVDQMISCDNRGAGDHDSLVINRTTGRIVESRPDWRFEGRCTRRAP